MAVLVMPLANLLAKRTATSSSSATPIRPMTAPGRLMSSATPTRSAPTHPRATRCTPFAPPRRRRADARRPNPGRRRAPAAITATVASRRAFAERRPVHEVARSLHRLRREPSRRRSGPAHGTRTTWFAAHRIGDVAGVEEGGSVVRYLATLHCDSAQAASRTLVRRPSRASRSSPPTRPAFVKDRALASAMRGGAGGPAARVSSAELPDGLVELRRSLQVAHVTGAGDHSESCVWDRRLELARHTER